MKFVIDFLLAFNLIVMPLISASLYRFGVALDQDYEVDSLVWMMSLMASIAAIVGMSAYLQSFNLAIPLIVAYVVQVVIDICVIMVAAIYHEIES